MKQADYNEDQVKQKLLKLLQSRTGHFLTESRFHTDLWFDTKYLFSDLNQLSPIVKELGKKLLIHKFDLICGPVDGGAKIAQMISKEFKIDFIISERLILNDSVSSKQLIKYSIPENFHNRIKGKKIAIVDDIINAGNATLETYRELINLGSIPVVLGSLIVKSDLIYSFAAKNNLSVEMILKCDNNMWLPQKCPLCDKQLFLESVV
jgi:orotate phosphoribosyltransferase